jgi:ribosomal protein S12 methylthiotransferase accessory factor YcaO
MHEPNVRSFSFTMRGLTDRESKLVQRFVDHIVERAKQEGRPLDLFDDCMPDLCVMIAAWFPEYSAKEVVGLALHVTTNFDHALRLAHEPISGGHA